MKKATLVFIFLSCCGDVPILLVTNVDAGYQTDADTDADADADTDADADADTDADADSDTDFYTCPWVCAPECMNDPEDTDPADSLRNFNYSCPNSWMCCQPVDCGAGAGCLEDHCRDSPEKSNCVSINASIPPTPCFGLEQNFNFYCGNSGYACCYESEIR